MATGGSSSGVSLSFIIARGDFTIKTHLDLGKVVGLLLEKKTLPKKSMTLIKAAKKSKNMNIFLQALTALDLEGFAVFLETLEEIGDESHCTVIKYFCTELNQPEVSALLSFDDSTSTAERHAIERIRRLEVTHLPQSSQSQTSTTTTQSSLHTSIPPETSLSDSPQSSGHILPPVFPSFSYQSPERETQLFSRQSNVNTFYSPTHGITVNIPVQAFPSKTSEFELSMTASLRSPIPIDSQYTLCSAVISLECRPPIEEFAVYITVEVPHCAMDVTSNPEHFCVLSSSTSDGMKFKEDPLIEIDFSDERYFAFRTKHFTRFAGARSTQKRKQKSVTIPQRRSSRISKKTHKANSLDARNPIDSPSTSRSRSQSSPAGRTNTPTAGRNRFYLTMVQPKRKEELESWKVAFLVAYGVPTGLKEIDESAIEIFNSDHVSPNLPIPFNFNREEIEVTPFEYSDESWEVKATTRPLLISRSYVISFFAQPETGTQKRKIPHYQFIVKRTAQTAMRPLNVDISLEGAISRGRKVAVTLECTPTSVSMCEPSVVWIPSFSNIYPEDSAIRKAFSCSINPEAVVLSLDDRNSVSFLAELSFHLRDLKQLGSHFNIPEYLIDNIIVSHPQSPYFFESAFQFLCLWLKQNRQCTLASLLSNLKRANVNVYQEHWGPLTQHHDEAGSCSAINELVFPRQIASQWRFVARFLGLNESRDIDCIAVEHSGSVLGVEECAVSVLELAKKRCIESSMLKDAIHAIYEHSRCLHDAMWFVSC